MLGVQIEKADGLSRRPDLKVGVEDDNENQKLINKKWIRGMIEKRQESSKSSRRNKEGRSKSIER